MSGNVAGRCVYIVANVNVNDDTRDMTHVVRVLVKLDIVRYVVVVLIN